jgi:exodeoxyribonuclease VIII
MDAPVTFAPGVYDGLDADVYHAQEAMSASGGKKILRTPAHFKLMRDKGSTPTAAMQFGTVCHTGILEPDAFDSRVVKAPKFDMRKNVDKAAAAEFEFLHAGKVMLQPAEFDRARRCIDAVLAHPAARYMLDGGIIERSLFWKDKLFDVPCKARLDISNHGGIIDLKSCEDASADGFSRAIGSFDYSLQAASNFSGSEHALNFTPSFFAFICVETEEPHCVKVWELGRESILFGLRQWDECLSRYAAALKAGKFAGYPETIDTINAPRWKFRAGNAS